MALRHGDRYQLNFFPESIEDYVSEDAAVRAYDVFADHLDLADLGIVVDRIKAGCPEYSPLAMLKLLIYGYSYGIRSSRKLERECNNNVSFIWLMGGLKPDHKTIARFRRNNKKALKKAIKQCAQLCIKLGLIDGNVLFVDGSKMRADASISNSWTQAKCEAKLKQLDSLIDKLLKDCESTDQSEEGCGSLVHIEKQLKNKEAFRTKVSDILKTLKESGRTSINTVDPDALRQSGRQGSHAGFNMQGTADGKHGLLVNIDVVSANNDAAQLSEQAKQALDVLSIIERTPDSHVTVCADAGYAKYEDLQKTESEDIEVVVPSQKQVSKKETGPFDKDKFVYDEEMDILVCPEGKVLSKSGIRNNGAEIIYRTDKGVCQACKHFGTCTKSTKGRMVKRYHFEAFKKMLETRYETVKGQEIYKQRKETIELIFGHIKRNLGAGHFLLRGLDGVRAEASLLGCVFNIRRMITIFGVKGLMNKLA